MKRILILRTDRLGDMVLTLPMASVIRKFIPDATIIFGLREYTRTIVECCPDVDEIVTINTDFSASKIARIIHNVNADVLFIPSPTFKLAVAAFLSRTPIRVSTGYRWYSFLFSQRIYEHRKTAECNEAEYNIRMLRVIGITTTDYLLPTIVIDHTDLSDKLHEPYAVLHLFTGGSASSWGIERFKEVANWLSKEKRLHVVLTGENKHNEFLLTVADQLKPLGIVIHIHTELTLIELAGLLQGASLVISGSTGPGHLAAALGAPTIGFFQLATALSKERWGFRGKKVVNLEPMKAPRQECPTCQGCDCMESITTMQVTQAAEQLLTQ